jgi:tetratricopeptide (TPR) repeat protein
VAGRAWSTLKLFYLYLQYFLVGLDEEGFQVTKGNYLVELGLYPAAAKAYQRALKETQSPYVHASLGFCYLSIGLSDRAVQSLRAAYLKKPQPDFGVLLAQALLEAGEPEESAQLHALLKRSEGTYAPGVRAELIRLEEALAASDGAPRPTDIVVQGASRDA